MRKILFCALMQLLLGATPALATNLPTLDNDTTVDCTLSATGDCVLSTNGASAASFNLSSSGASGLTYTFQGTSDGSHWFNIGFGDPTADSYSTPGTTASATSGQWKMAAGAYAKIRFHLTAYTAGTLTIHGEAGGGVNVTYLFGSLAVTCAACALETGGNLAALKADADTLAGAVSGSKFNTRSYFSTANADAQPHVCGLYKFVHITAATDTQVVAASGSTNIFVCDFEFSAAASVDFFLEKGTSGTCGGLTQIGIIHHAPANMTAKASNAFYRGLNTGTSNQLCVNTSTTGPFDFGVFYDQY